MRRRIMDMEYRKTIYLLTTKCLILAILLSGCSIGSNPRLRLGTYASDTPGTNFICPTRLGNHSYKYSFFERNGIVYTCRGGHIDITHLRITADYTKFLTGMVKECLNSGRSDFTFKLNVEPSIYFATLKYPESWDKIDGSQKQTIIDEISLELGQYLTFQMTTWHEILTWYGYKCMWILPETPSAFSWEDIYSNLLGVRLAEKALKDTQHSYDEAMTIAINDELEYLGVQPPKIARAAASKMQGKWYDGFMFVNMKQRNMDTGLDDGFVSPLLSPDISECPGALPQSYPAPNLNKLNSYGFEIDVKIEPREFEKGKILKHIYPDGGGKFIDIEKDIPIILAEIEKEAHDKGYITMPY